MKKLVSLSLLFAVPFCAEAMNDNNKSGSISPKSAHEEWEKSHDREQKILDAQLNKKDLCNEIGRTIEDHQKFQAEVAAQVINQQATKDDMIKNIALQILWHDMEKSKAINQINGELEKQRNGLSSFQQYALSQQENAQQKAAALEHLNDILNGNEQDTQKSLKKLQATMLNNSEEDSSSGDSGDNQFYNLSSDFSDTDEIMEYLTNDSKK